MTSILLYSIFITSVAISATFGIGVATYRFNLAYKSYVIRQEFNAYDNYKSQLLILLLRNRSGMKILLTEVEMEEIFTNGGIDVMLREQNISDDVVQAYRNATDRAMEDGVWLEKYEETALEYASEFKRFFCPTV